MSRLARQIAEVIGTPHAFVSACILIVLWAAAGPYLHYSENWQLIINTGTTILSFLMLFLLQHAQNHDTKAIHVKLDELIVRLPQPRNEIAGIEKEVDL